MEDHRGKHDGALNSLESIGTALRRSMRRSLEAIDSSDEEEVLGVLLSLYGFTTMLLAEEAHAWGVIDPLDELQAQAEMLSDGYPELKSPVVRRADDDGAGGD